MKRDNIDAAIIAQINRQEALLRDVIRSGGRDRWSHLFSHGHKFPTVRSAVARGYLKEVLAYEYEITPEGQWLIDSAFDAMRKAVAHSSTHRDGAAE